MMPLDNQTREVVTSLLDKTKAKLLHWQTGDNAFLLDAGDALVSVSWERDQSGRPVWSLALRTRTGQEFWKTVADACDPDRHVLEQLFDAAKDSTVQRVFERLKVFEEPAAANRTIPTFTTTTTTTPPPLPSRPSYGQTAEIFKRISGVWDLDYTTGKERARITPKGEYFIEGAERKYAGMPKFRLALIACDQDLSKIEIAKDFVDGRRHDTELLYLQSNLMEGESVGGKRKVRYVRVGSTSEAK